MKRREVNLGRTDENIADQYPNLCEGLQKDAGQNSWDARATKRGKDWKLVFNYIPQLNTLTIEDFGTFGMNSKRWKEYQSLWDTAKTEETKLGARGQGKFLFHYFAKNKIVLTESIDEEGIYHFSYGTTEEYDDENKKLKDIIPNTNPLDHQGTRIWIMDLKPELRNELLDYKAFMAYIAATWWEIIRNWNAIFIVNFDGTDRRVELPKLPTVVKEKVFTNEKINGLGLVKSLALRYCESELPELFRGIAIQRGGMTIVRLPISADEIIKGKIYGYCTFDEDLETELKKVEFPNHFGFNNKRAWNHVREYIRRKSDEFAQEIIPLKRKEVPLPTDLIERAVLIVNNLVREYAPELSTEATGPKGKRPKPTPPKPPKEPPPIRIDTFRGNANRLEYDESLITECELVNDTESVAKLQLKMEIKHREGDMKAKSSYKIILDGNKREKIDIPLIDFQENVDKPGEYKASAILENEEGEELNRRSFTFYLHEEPPAVRGKVFLSTMVFSYGKGTPIEKKKHLPVTEEGRLRIIFDHPDFVHVRELAGTSKKTQSYEILLYMIKCGIDEAIEQLLAFKYNEGQLDADEMRTIKDKRDAMYYDAISTSSI